MARITLATRNAEKVIAKLRRYSGESVARCQGVIENSAERTYQMAQGLCPVGETGFMKSAMRKEIAPDGLSYQMGFWATDFAAAGLDFYALHVELGSRTRTARPCIFPTGEAERPRFRAEVKEALRPQ